MAEPRHPESPHPEPRWSLQDAKNRFSTVVAAAQRGRPQTVTKRGQPAVVVVSVQDFDRLRGLHAAETPSFVDHLLALPQDDAPFDAMASVPREVDF